MIRHTRLVVSLLLLALLGVPTFADDIRTLQQSAIESGKADWGHWGMTPDNYMQWGSHSNRLIPVYTFGTLGKGQGIELKSYTGENSPYRSEEKLKQLYGQLPSDTLNEDADYLDQTNLYDLQKAALEAGKKHLFLIVFDGMDWQTTWAASIAKNKGVKYEDGRGQGLHLQDYQADGTTEFGWMVTSPYVTDVHVDVDAQTITRDSSAQPGGYAVKAAGEAPWSQPTDIAYLIGESKHDGWSHAYTDSASSATSMNAGVKTYNASINVDMDGKQVETIAHQAQKQGYRIGVVSSVPISHATPAAAYAHNVHRDDYQDLTRDLLGLPSISHPSQPLPGVDVLIGAGFGGSRTQDEGQGKNFVPGNANLTDEDLQKVDRRHGGQYYVALREQGVDGGAALKTMASEAADLGTRFLGYYGGPGGHLPFQTADGDYDPTVGRRRRAERYSDEEIQENPTLAEMTQAALTVLGRDETPFWLMVEAGDVDWANHDNNIDNSIGAVLSGDDAVKTVTDWVEKNSNWDESVVIVTADHGHYLFLTRPEALAEGNHGDEAGE